MRRLVLMATLAALGIALLAGCGSSSSSSTNPVTTELSYFPSGSPFVLSIATDPNSSAVKGGQALIHRFPIATLGETALMARISQLGLDYQSDIRPLFGNPVMIGANGATLSGSQSQNYLIVWVTKSADKLNALIKKAFPSASTSSHDGATLYSNGTATAAVSGPNLVFGPSSAAVSAALDRHAQNSGFSQATYSRLLTGVPQSGLIQAFGSLSSVLSQPSAAKARRVPWVAALRGYGMSIGASSGGLTFSYRLDTTGASLTEAQVPFATGTSAPQLASALPIAAGIQNPAHIAQFAESAEQASSPAGYAKFQAREAASRKKTGADLNSLIKLLTGNLIVSSNTRVTMARADVTDPAQAASTLSKLLSAPKLVFTKATGVSKLGGGFYGINEPGQTITIGVVGKQLVVGKATPAQLRAFALAPTSPAAGAQGSVAFRISLLQLIQLGLKNSSPPAVAQTILKTLGDVTGWTSASTSGITGNATLAVH